MGIDGILSVASCRFVSMVTDSLCLGDEELWSWTCTCLQKHPTELRPSQPDAPHPIGSLTWNLFLCNEGCRKHVKFESCFWCLTIGDVGRNMKTSPPPDNLSEKHMLKLLFFLRMNVKLSLCCRQQGLQQAMNFREKCSSFLRPRPSVHVYPRNYFVRHLRDLSGMWGEMQWLIPILSSQVKGMGDESPPSLFSLFGGTCRILIGDWMWKNGQSSSNDQWVNRIGKHFKGRDKKGTLFSESRSFWPFFTLMRENLECACKVSDSGAFWWAQADAILEVRWWWKGGSEF